MGDPSVSFEGREPPHPDILYCRDGSEQIAFELVESRRAYARRLALMLGTIQDLPKYFERQDQEIRDKIARKFSDAMIFVQFLENVSMAQRRKLFPGVFGLLAETEFEGAGDIPLEKPLSNALERLTVYRGDIDGPRFESASSGFLGDPTVPTIAAKFAKKYEADTPLHLLAYVEGNPMLPDEIWLQNTEEFVIESAPNEQFDTIWIFDVGEGVIKYRWDRDAA